jgi:Na+/H+-dicarboxylate symporter
VLPRIIEKMEAYGAPASITSFVVPTGYSFNLDGSTLYQSIAAIFIAQLYGIDLSLWQEIVLVLTLMVTSKGIAGVPGVSFVVLLATLGSVGIPLEGLAFIAGVDRILDMARTALNVVGNALAVLVIAKWEHKFDRKKRWRMNARCWVVLIRRLTSNVKSPVALRLPGRRPGKRSATGQFTPAQRIKLFTSRIKPFGTAQV